VPYINLPLTALQIPFARKWRYLSFLSKKEAKKISKWYVPKQIHIFLWGFQCFWGENHLFSQTPMQFSTQNHLATAYCIQRFVSEPRKEDTSLTQRKPTEKPGREGAGPWVWG
jgi:hypothetical protein